MDQLPTVNRSLLTTEQRKNYDAWLELFASRGWDLMNEYFGPIVDQVLKQYSSLVGEQALGFTQGQERAYRRVFGSLRREIDIMFLYMTGQLEEEDDGSLTEDLIQPGNWNG